MTSHKRRHYKDQMKADGLDDPTSSYDWLYGVVLIVIGLVILFR